MLWFSSKKQPGFILQLPLCIYEANPSGYSLELNFTDIDVHRHESWKCIRAICTGNIITRTINIYSDSVSRMPLLFHKIIYPSIGSISGSISKFKMEVKNAINECIKNYVLGAFLKSSRHVKL